MLKKFLKASKPPSAPRYHIMEISSPNWWQKHALIAYPKFLANLMLIISEFVKFWVQAWMTQQLWAEWWWKGMLKAALIGWLSLELLFTVVPWIPCTLKQRGQSLSQMLTICWTTVKAKRNWLKSLFKSWFLLTLMLLFLGDLFPTSSSIS